MDRVTELRAQQAGIGTVDLEPGTWRISRAMANLRHSEGKSTRFRAY
jgi:hypothetical protein